MCEFDEAEGALDEDNACDEVDSGCDEEIAGEGMSLELTKSGRAQSIPPYPWSHEHVASLCSVP
mgnify:CR=1 FL=1